MNRYWQISLAVLLAFSSGCHKYTTVKPETKNVAGAYQPTPGNSGHVRQTGVHRDKQH